MREFIKGFCTRIEELESHSTPRTPPEEKEQREITAITLVESIKRLDEECVKLCEESVQIWTNLMEDMEMKDVEDILRDA
jgi:hypothetical protein